VSKGEPVVGSSHNSDISGLESFFDVTASDDKADTAVTRTIEVPISEAARRLGITERTIWRRINRGELRSRTKGNKRLVKIPLVMPGVSLQSDGHMTLTDTPRQASALVDLQALLRDLQSANYRLGFLQAQLDEHQQKVKLLPDLQARASEAETLRMHLSTKEAELRSIKSTWWYRFWSWLTGRGSV
jgi:excisionase family DNA binding protein